MKADKINPLKDIISGQLSGWDITGLANDILTNVTLLVLLFIINLAFYHLIQFFLRPPFTNIFKKREGSFKNRLIENNVVKNISLLIPLIISINLIHLWFSSWQEFSKVITIVFKILIILEFFGLLKNFSKASKDYLITNPKYRDKPLDSYLQVITILINTIVAIIIFSIVTGFSTWKFLGSLGAASAVLMLIFKDTILGFVASIQISVNNMVKLGDWIEMPQFNIDGEITEISLNTVKVKGSNNTVTTLPTYKLVTESITNWSGVKDSRSRRIKRSVNISAESVKFMSFSDLERLKKTGLATLDIVESSHKKGLLLDDDLTQITNLTLLRLYALSFLKDDPNINQSKTILVRLLEPNQNGIPLELYAYSNSDAWLPFEKTMTEIFEHIIAITPYFGLRIVEISSN